MNTSKYTQAPTRDRVPDHLKPFLAEQDPALYTALDHIAWRFILRTALHHFRKHAHPVYLKGLEATGISLEHIPLVSDMDAKLRAFGWGAVPVNGFIPPAVFMEFQALGLLPIACEMRTLEHLEYTPAPDIVHEAAGHAPILADAAFSRYLRQYGDAAKMAIFSSKDVAVYEAIRHLSVVKEDPKSSVGTILEAEDALKNAWADMNFVSEALQLARLNWWTAEYGLIGPLEAPKIYGAGLLSSLGESETCLGNSVTRLPFSLQSLVTSYDITKPQPQLFVTPSFEVLTEKLSEFETTMAFKIGGIEGLAKALQAGTVCTYVLDSGLEISGILETLLLDEETGDPVFFKTKGPTQLSYKGRELEGQSAKVHAHGYSTPIGIEQTLKKPLSEASVSEISSLQGIFRFASGFEVKGKVLECVTRNNLVLLIRLEECSVTKSGKIFYDPSWGVFDLGCGDEVVSVYGGPSDRVNYLRDTGGYRKIQYAAKTNLTKENSAMNEMVSRWEKEGIRKRTLSIPQAEAMIKELKTCPNYSRDGWVVLLDQLLGSQPNSEIKTLISDELKLFSSTTSTMSDRLATRIPQAYELH